MRKTLLAFIGIIAFVMAGPLLAQEWPVAKVAPPKEIPKPLVKLQEEGAQIRYLGKYDNFHGWIVFNKGRPTFTYTSDDNDMFFQGMLFDARGENVTLQQLQEFRMRDAGDSFDSLNEVSRMIVERQKQEGLINANEKLTKRVQNEDVGSDETTPEAENTPDNSSAPSQQSNNTAPIQAQGPDAASQQQSATLSKSDRLMQDMAGANWLSFGNAAAPEIYALIDPDCVFCRKAMAGFKPYIDAGQIEIRLVPVGFTPKAKRVGALVLAAADGMALYYNYIAGKNNDLGKDVSINTQGVDRNMTVMDSWGFDATPMIFYRNAAGQVKIVKGAPGDYDVILQDISGS
ncbi:MAG: hypothetical protein CMH32_06305 [Micavibrio sp.]|nr:hypothetical protein [Micavibrio sp.]HCK33449.1 hypothetical protein [Rhodospirillaceae bacterium]